MIFGETGLDKSLELRKKHIDRVRKILVKNGYGSQLLRDVMKDVTSHIMETPEKGLLFAVATALEMIHAKHGIATYELQEARDSEKKSMEHTIKNEMSEKNQASSRRRLFLGD